MVAWIRHIVFIGVSMSTTTRIAEDIAKSSGAPVFRHSSHERGMRSGWWLEQRLSSGEESVIVSPPIGDPFTYHVLMNRDRTTSRVVHVLTADRDEERWARVSSFYRHISDAEVWSADDYDIFALKDGDDKE